MSKNASIICITAIIIISILFCFIPTNREEIPTSSPDAVMSTELNVRKVRVTSTPEPTPTPKTLILTYYKSEESEKFLWETLNKYTENERITAGIMGMFWRESCFRSDAIAGWGTTDAFYGGDTSKEFTEKIDAGLADGSTRDYFIEQCHYIRGGYGLNQLYSSCELEPFYDFAQEWGTSIGDAEMQCAFTVWNMQTNFPELWEMIINDTDVVRIGRNIAIFYDGTTTGDGAIASFAQEYYNKYSNQEND